MASQFIFKQVCLTMRRFASLRAANYHGCQAIMHLCRTEGNRHELGTYVHTDT